MTFASRIANLEPPKGLGEYCMRLHGQVYHLLGALYTYQNEKPKYAQLYFLDAEQALEQRMKHKLNQKCLESIMQ